MDAQQRRFSDDDDAIDKFNKVGSVPVARRTPEQRKKDLDDTLNWLRNKGKDDDITDPTGEFRKLDSMLPHRRGQTPEDRARELEGALDWLRNRDVSPSEDEGLPAFNKAGSVPFARRTPEQRTEDLDNALNWLRNKGKDDDTNDPTGEFRKLDSMLPVRRGQVVWPAYHGEVVEVVDPQSRVVRSREEAVLRRHDAPRFAPPSARSLS